MLTQITLVWDTGMMTENADGAEIPAMIQDSWLTFSLHEKANLTKRLKSILGPDFDVGTAKVTLELDGAESLNDLTHWKEGRTEITRFDINGESIFGKQALVQIEINANNYNRVTNVSAPMRQNAKLKPRGQEATPAAP